MWKVRSSLAWRIARDFSRRSLQTLRNCASSKEGSPSTSLYSHQKPLNFTKSKERHKEAK